VAVGVAAHVRWHARGTSFVAPFGLAGARYSNGVSAGGSLSGTDIEHSVSVYHSERNQRRSAARALRPACRCAMHVVLISEVKQQQQQQSSSCRGFERHTAAAAVVTLSGSDENTIHSYVSNLVAHSFCKFTLL
jgi:hypothetical protein